MPTTRSGRRHERDGLPPRSLLRSQRRRASGHGPSVSDISSSESGPAWSRPYSKRKRPPMHARPPPKIPGSPRIRQSSSGAMRPLRRRAPRSPASMTAGPSWRPSRPDPRRQPIMAPGRSSVSGRQVLEPLQRTACATWRRPSGAGRIVLALLALAVLFLAPSSAPGQTPQPDAHATPSAASSAEPGPRVLLLYSEPRMTPAIVKVDEGMRRIIQARSPRPVFFYTEYLDLNLFDGVVPQREMRELLRRKYETRKIDLIVTAGRALRIALHNRADLFADAPIVFVASDPASNADLQAQTDVTGTWLRIPWSETLDLARRLHPGLRRAVAVGGTSPSDRVWLSAARRQFAAYPGPIAVSYLADLSVEDILRAVKALPPHTVVILGAFLRDANGRDSTTLGMARQIVAASPVPVYGPNETI